MIVVFASELKLSVRTFDAGARSLGRLAHQPEVAADREHGAVGEL